MVASTVPKILAQLRQHEGGYVNHPKDPGGATKWGVTHRTYDAYRRGRHLPARSVRDMTEDEYMAILRGQYWVPMGCDDLPAGVDYAVFDIGWNSGPVRAAKILRSVLGLPPGNSIGNQAIAAAKAAPDKAVLAGRITDAHLAFMKSLKKLWPTFGKGWTARKAGVKRLSMQIASGAPEPVSKAPAAGGGAVVTVGAAAATGDWWIAAAVALVVVGGVAIYAWRRWQINKAIVAAAHVMAEETA